MSNIHLEVADNIATITFNRPEARNAFSQDMRVPFLDILQQIRSNSDIRAVILTGAGGSFCAGGDIKGMDTAYGNPEGALRRMQGVHPLIKQLVELPVPLIAAVDGPAFGAGFSFALTADFVLATPRARFCMAFARLGLIPDCGAFYLLPRVCGLQRAKDLFYSARVIDAEQAQSYDIVYEITPQDGLMERARELAYSFTRSSSLALSLTKSAMAVTLENDLPTMLDLEASGQALALNSPYHQDAAQRFKNKEPILFHWPEKEK